ncbi:MAG: hypothetical protein UW19_C0001G0122 [Candidatus Moranbacteria bacterium GW2011_GWF2_44_10]|nr:MAG: hypothetical protein UW19_C0001G0122 [Candidatus Moranbacteria bacterium GW2011_GWF2_44_10]
MGIWDVEYRAIKKPLFMILYSHSEFKNLNSQFLNYDQEIIFISSFSLMIFTPNSLALSYFEPGFLPTMT